MSRRVLLQVAILLSVALAGCVEDQAVPASGPLSLHEAHRLGTEAVSRMGSLNLVGFVGHEGAPPRFLEGLLGDFAVDADTSFDGHRWDGRTAAWSLLYGSPEGDLYQVIVRDAPRVVQVAHRPDAPAEVVQQLWAMNLGGRLVIDSDAALERLIAADRSIATYRDEHERADLVYASTVAPIDGPGSEDLVYEIYMGPPDADGRTFERYGHVHHFTGRVVASGDAASMQEHRRVTLLEETFTVGPVPSEVSVEEQLPRRVHDAVLTLGTSGHGRFVFEILHEDEPVAQTDGIALGEPDTERLHLGTLEPGAYRLRVEVQGRVTFDLLLEGTIGI